MSSFKEIPDVHSGIYSICVHILIQYMLLVDNLVIVYCLEGGSLWLIDAPGHAVGR